MRPTKRPRPELQCFGSSLHSDAAGSKGLIRKRRQCIGKTPDCRVDRGCRNGDASRQLSKPDPQSPPHLAGRAFLREREMRRDWKLTPLEMVLFVAAVALMA